MKAVDSALQLDMVAEHLSAQVLTSPPVTADDEGSLPAELRNWLVQLRLLQAVPFAYLVADSELLPEESIRWFYLDRRWTDALVMGALSVGTVNSDDRILLAARYQEIRDELDREERQVRRPEDAARLSGDGGPISGFLLRSRVVAGWPAMHVRAFSVEPDEADDARYEEDDRERLRLLRLERLAPAVLLCLFDGIPEVVHLEEPRQGVQFGFDSTPSGTGVKATLRPRDLASEYLPGSPLERALPQQRQRRGQHQGTREEAPPRGARARPGAGQRGVRPAAGAVPLPAGVGRCQVVPGQRRLQADRELPAVQGLRRPGGRAVSGFQLEPGLAARAVASSRLDFLGRVDVDLSTIGTWDRHLSRRTRILVPIDVQAFVATTAAPEPTVDIRGADGDPEPFADGGPRAAGVHLHWALPDALLRATHAEGETRPAMADLPDAWVVVRTLQPAGRQQAIPTGWVVDARTGVVTALPAYVGPADVSAATDLISPLDGARFGMMALASYTACVDRFAFHDPLTDLADLAPQAPQGFTGGQAVYTVAGWWTDETQDPLHGARGPAGLDTVLAGLGWYVEHDANDDDVVEPDTRTVKMATRLGLRQPAEQPAPRVFGSDGRTVTGLLSGVSHQAAYPVDSMRSVLVGDALPTYHSLLHGSVLGVPVDGTLPSGDDRPAPDSVTVAVGADTDDVAAGFGTAGLGLGDDAKALAEDALEAFVTGTSMLLGTPDGLDEFAGRQHTQGFWSLPGTPVPGATPDRLRVQDTLATGPLTVGRKGRADLAAARAAQRATRTGGKAASSRAGTGAVEVANLTWRRTFDLAVEGMATVRPRIDEAVSRPDRPVDQGRTVPRPPPRFHRPAPVVLALRGAHPSHRHHGDGLFDSSGRLLCRYPRSAVPAWEGLVDGSTVLPTLGSGAIPPEVTTVVREALLLNPYGNRWLAEAGAPKGSVVDLYATRLSGEMVRLYGAEGRYDGTAGLSFSAPKATTRAAAKAASGGWGELRQRVSPEVQQVTAELARFSVLRGTPPSPLALTTWRQPWVPLWLEWEVTLVGSASVRGWRLDGYDLEPQSGPDAPAEDVTMTLHGRSPLGQGVGKQVQAAVSAWLKSESQRAVTNRTDPYSGQDVLAELGALGAPLDIVSASLDGLREQLLGLDYVGQVRRDSSGTVIASGEPTPLFGGIVRLDRLRVVDAFGRTLTPTEEALDRTVTTTALEVDGTPRTVRLRPRLQHSARWLLRLVDAAQAPGTASDALQDANIDELDPGAARNPVAGFMLPDHIDESLESFTVAGGPLGEIGHDPITGAVTWEPAPGRAVRADAGPLEGTLPQDRLVAEVAAGLVRADAAARALPPEQRPAESALVNLLRAVDTTLWTVDTFATVGSGTVAGLVGRPIAVVRAALRLDLPDDLDEVHVQADSGAAGRQARFDALGDELVEVKLGTLTRSDDALLGYFVDDDYEHLHLVDKVVAASARLSGRLVGQLGLLGQDSGQVPPTTSLDHPYLVDDGVLRVRPRQTTMLTLMLLPMGKVHVTSGLLPRKEIALADSWTAAGLRRLVPSVRVGPLLVDPAEIRLPLVSLLGDKQTFTRRTGELTWKDDPIVAASQTAYLPRLPHEVQEGWIRVTPSEEEP